LRERFDAGTGLVAVGAVLLLVSLFIDWYDPGGDAWAVFESLDVLLAGAAVCGLLAVVPRFGAGGLGRALPIITVAAFAVVLVQLIDPPPAVRDSDIATGGWLALAATVTMAGGAILGAASISVTVDVRGRERRRRTAAIDARERAAEAPAVATDDDGESVGRRFARGHDSLFGARERDVREGRETREPAAAAAEPAEEDPQRTQALDPVEPTQE
jgi:hypothetical protein